MVLKLYSYITPFLCYTFLISTCVVNNDSIRQEYRNNSHAAEKRNVYIVNYDNDVDSQNKFEYNKDGDIIKQYSSKDTIIFIYDDHKIVKKYKNQDADWLSEITYNINEKGKIESSYLRDKEGHIVSNYQYKYDEQDFLIKTIQKLLAGNKIYVNNFRYEDDNLIEVTSFGDNGQMNSKFLLEYEKSLFNDLNLNPDPFLTDIIGNERMGKRNKNALKQLINVSDTGDTLSILKYRYTPNSNRDSLRFRMEDVLNRNETLITYHFNPQHK